MSDEITRMLGQLELLDSQAAKEANAIVAPLLRAFAECGSIDTLAAARNELRGRLTAASTLQRG